MGLFLVCEGFLITSIVVIIFTSLIFIISRIKKCPSDKIMVIYGLVKGKDGMPAICIHGGARFIIPIIQAYQFLDLTPISIYVDLKKAIARQDTRIDLMSRLTVGISTESGVMENAAQRLLGLHLIEIQELAKDIIFPQFRNGY